MARKLLTRLSCGFSITVCVCLVVQLIVAQTTGNSVTLACAAHFRNEAAAALAQLGLTGCIGAAFAGAAELFEIGKWGYLKQGIVHFLVTAAVWMPIVYICWMPSSRRSMLFTVLGWTFTYAVNWTVQYLLYKRSIAELNRRIRAYREGDGHACD